MLDFGRPWLVSVLPELSFSFTHAFRIKLKIKNTNIVKKDLDSMRLIRKQQLPPEKAIWLDIY